MPGIANYNIQQPDVSDYINAQAAGQKQRALDDASQQDTAFRQNLPGMISGDKTQTAAAMAADPERAIKIQGALSQMSDQDLTHRLQFWNTIGAGAVGVQTLQQLDQVKGHWKELFPQYGSQIDNVTLEELPTLTQNSQDAQKLIKAAQDANHVAAELGLQRSTLGETSRHNRATEAALAAGGKPPTGYTWNPEHSMLVAIPGGPAGQGSDDYVNAVANYQVAPNPRSANYQQTISAALKVNPNYDVKRFNSANRALGAFTSGAQGNTVRSLNVSVAHLEALRDMGDALHNNDIQAFNSLAQTFAAQTGSPAPTNFDTAKSIVADEVAKGVIGGTTAQNDREQLAASIQRASSPQQLAGAVDTFQRLLAGQLGGLRHQYENATGAKDFEQMLNPETRRVLERFPEAGAVTSSSTSSNAPRPSSDGWTVKRVK